MPLRCVIFILTFVIAALAVGRDISEISCIWSAAVSAVNILTIALLICIARKNGSSYKELINFNRENISLKKVLLTAAASVVIGMACMYLSGLICYGTLMPAVFLKMIAPVPKALAVIDLSPPPLRKTDCISAQVWDTLAENMQDWQCPPAFTPFSTASCL